MNRIRALWWMISGSLWLVPSIVVVAAMGLAALLISWEGALRIDLAQDWPRLFGAGADGARSMLSAIAGSMITVAGVVFSVTLVALTLTATQYSPRVIRTFMHDRPTQIVLGVFVGVFAYCLVVLRSIRGEDVGGPFVPSIAVFGGMVLAFVAIAFLVFYIHHLAVSIEASSILARLTDATLAVFDELFPADADASEDVDEAGEREEARIADWVTIPAPASGYVVSVDHGRLADIAQQLDGVLKMGAGTGDFVVEGGPLVLYAPGMPLQRDLCEVIGRCYTLERIRTVEQDAKFGVQQIVDVALKALSPGINDQTTAITCIDRLTQLMVHVAGRRICYRYRRAEGRLRLICAGSTFDEMLRLAFEEILRHATDNRAVLARLRWAQQQVGAAARDPARRAAVARLSGEIEAALAAHERRAQAILR
jgi:uncharacterized membrane protein